MNIELGDRLTLTLPRDQVNTILVALTKFMTWEQANPAITTIMNAAKADFDYRHAPETLPAQPSP
jgi:hypothetical protein